MKRLLGIVAVMAGMFLAFPALLLLLSPVYLSMLWPLLYASQPAG
ncbi:hypothetical protein AB9P05_01640 [Roseivirga sp. BDSF3-8]